jgi:hypothetical protein
MNDSISVMHRPRCVWLSDVLTATAIIATVVLALLTSVCGGGGSPAPPAGPTGASSGVTQALAYAKCMRLHGISDFPGPNPPGSGGQFSFGSIDTHAPGYQSADKTCERQTGFGHFSAAQLQQGMTAMLNYAKCMRSHGITSFPDPFGNSQQIGFNITGIDTNSPRFKAANKTCQPLMPGDGP